MKTFNRNFYAIIPPVILRSTYKYLLVGIVLLGCSDKVIPIKGSYPTPPIQQRTEKSFDEVWDKLVDVFAQKGLSIKIIDRSSGLIVSGAYQLETTIEDKNNNLLNPKAYIVVAKTHETGSGKDVPITGYGFAKKTGKMIPTDAFGELNVRIKKDGSGSIINVNLVNVYYESLINKVPTKINLVSYRTTGVFEKELADLID